MREDNDRQKLRYEKPVLSRFTLRVEEAVLGFCKSTVVVSAQGKTAGCKNVQKCFTQGS